MNLLELSIIYLACGAPFGVYFFFQKHETQRLWQKSPVLWLNCVLISLLWLPYSFKLLQGFVTKKLRKYEFVEKNQSDSQLLEKIDEFEKSFAQILLMEKTGIALFDFRETFQRYVGLSLEYFSEVIEQTTESNELYRLIEHKKPQLGTICLNRRNRLRLKNHQNQARIDFLQLIKRINSGQISKEKFSPIVFGFAKLINDVELTAGIQQIFENSTQTDNDFTVRNMEIEVWNPIEQKPLPTKKTALNLPTISVGAMMSKQD